jgi:hypothetical protein
VLTKNSPKRRGEIQTIPGAPHKEGTQQATPNHLEASFKSNKHESMPGDASSALEMKEMEGALKASLSHTLNQFLTQALVQRNRVLALGGSGGEECRAYSLGTHTRKDEDGLLLEFLCNPTRTCTV